MKLIANLILNMMIIFVVDALWINGVAGGFYAQQLAEIGRFTADGGWDVRLLPGIGVYLCMAVAVEVFVFRNPNIYGLKATVLHGALLGFVIYGVYDLTNRAILENYPMAMVVVDMAWGSSLFALIAYINFQLRQRLTFL